MAYADIKAAILVHVVAAGATLTPPIIDVVAAFPIPKGRCIRVWGSGETEPLRMGGKGTINSELVGKVTEIVAFLPITTTGEDHAALIDADMETLMHEIRTRINGDAQLGGATTDSTLEYVEVDFPTLNNTRYVVMAWRCITDYIEYPHTP